MQAMRLVPFDESMLDAAAALLAARQQRVRRYEPALPERFTEPGGARLAVEAAWREPAVSGAAALRLRDGQMIGFVIGAPQIAQMWGRSVWVRYGGHALATDVDAEVYRDLYAAAAPDWLARGCFAHYVELSADDPAGIDAWFRLSFGLQHAHGILHLPADLPQPPGDTPFSIRRAGPDDVAIVADMATILWTHLGRSPVYSVRLPEDIADRNAEAARVLADPKEWVWLAEQDGTVLGMVVITPLTEGDALLDVPERCCFLDIAATREEARGRGISTALSAHALSEAHVGGYTCALTDWRVTNLPASRVWPRLGFRPFRYRLHRLIDQRIAWAPTFPE